MVESDSKEMKRRRMRKKGGVREKGERGLKGKKAR